MPRTPTQMRDAILRRVPEKTGKPVEHWVELVRRSELDSADVNIEARKDYVAFSRRRQFAVVRASTKTRVDLGLRLTQVKPLGRLVEARNLGSGMIDRKVELKAPGDIDAEVLAWLGQAYSGAG